MSIKNNAHALAGVDYGAIPIDFRKILHSGLLLTWLGTILAGIFFLLTYANAPGQPGSPSINWPESSRVPRNSQLPTLVMFMHPHCPCSRASVGELALLMAHCQGRVTAQVFFLQPTGMAPDWVLTDLWREAALIPGVAVHQDVDGREARLFGAETSGLTALYDANGHLMFHGGITISRGHWGDNQGHDSLQALLWGAPAKQTQTPVFGCSLFECNLNDRH